MASNAPAHASNMLSNRVSYKIMKLESPAILRTYQQATIVSVNAKDANKDKERDRKTRRHSSMLKQHGKATTAGTAAAGAVARAGACVVPQATSTKPSLKERTVVLSKHIDHVRHAEQAQYKQTQKSRMHKAVSRTKGLRPAAAEADAHLTSKHPKEAKSAEKGEAGGHRQTRNKSQGQNTKQFFDKYLKFAYDLSTPEGVRKLEAHFFPPNSSQSKLNRKKGDSGDVTEKRNTL